MGWRGFATYSSSGPAACAVFPAAGSLRVFGSPGVCTSASLVTWVGLPPFPGDVGWASALPFFSGLLLLRLLAGVVGVLHPVSGCSSCGVVCLVCRWGSPAAFFFTLEWVCFWPKVSQEFVGCEGGLGCPSWFVILFLCLHPFRVRQHVWLQLAGLLPGLVWEVLCCATWFSPMCRALPLGLQRALFSLLQVPLVFLHPVSGCFSCVGVCLG